MGNLIAGLDFKLHVRVALIQRALINHGGEGRLVEYERSTPALFRIISKGLLIWHQNLATL